MIQTELLTRINNLIKKGQAVLDDRAGPHDKYVNTGLFSGFRAMGLSFIFSLFGENHAYYKEFNSTVSTNWATNVLNGINILQAILEEVERGWLTTLKKLVTAEVFSDFMEMAKYLLDEKYKDPAAVIIGSVLEEHLRQLCTANGIEITRLSGMDTVPKKAESLNMDLVKEGIYGVLEQKTITAWLDLRNRAAHGKYSEYQLEKVNLMYQGVLQFISSTSK